MAVYPVLLFYGFISWLVFIGWVLQWSSYVLLLLLLPNKHNCYVLGWVVSHQQLPITRWAHDGLKMKKKNYLLWSYMCCWGGGCWLAAVQLRKEFSKLLCKYLPDQVSGLSGHQKCIYQWVGPVRPCYHGAGAVVSSGWLLTHPSTTTSYVGHRPIILANDGRW